MNVRSDEIRAEIAALEQRELAIAARIPELMDSIRSTMVAGAAPWMRHEAKVQITENATRAAALGAQGLAVVKREVDDLIANLPAVVEQATSDPKEWQSGKARYSPENTRSEMEGFIWTAYRRVVSRLGNVLHPHGLLSIDRGSYANWKRETIGFRYQISINFETSSNPAFKEYFALLAERKTNASLMEKKKAELSETSAVELWDSL